MTNSINWICELRRETWDTLALNTCLFKFLKQCMVFGFLEVNSVRKKWKIYLNFKIPEIFGFLDLGLSLEPKTWLYLFGLGISQTQPKWGHTQNFSSFGPLILHLSGGGWISPPPSLKSVAGTPSLLGLKFAV